MSAEPRRFRFRRIVFVEGGIGSGKTTLLASLDSEGYDVLYEPVERWRTEFLDAGGCNVLDVFYADPEKNSFLMQVTALSTRMADLQRRIAEGAKHRSGVLYVERSIWSDLFVFCNTLHDTAQIGQLEVDVLMELFGVLVKQVKSVTLHNFDFVYLRTRVDTCVERIENRRRSEEKRIPREYLAALHESHEATFAVDMTDDHRAVICVPLETRFEIIDADDDPSETLRRFRFAAQAE